jgi:hypothetical protein
MVGFYLVENIEWFDGLELVLLVHVVLRHDLFELGACHVDGRPTSVGRKLEEILLFLKQKLEKN